MSAPSTTPPRRGEAGLGSAVLMAIVALSCGDPTLTEVFVCYEIDPELVGDTTEASICATDDTGEILFGCGSTLTDLGRDGLRRSQAFVQEDAERLILSVEAEVPGSLPGTVRSVSQAIDVPFAPGRIIDVSLRLEVECLDRVCLDGQTCVEGRCVDQRIASTRCLTDHDDEPDPLCIEMEPRLARGCPAPSDAP